MILKGITMDNIKAQDQEKEAIRSKILELTKEYFKKVHDKSHEAFIPNESRVPYAARVFDENEMCNLMDAALEFWLTEGRFTHEFEKKLADILLIEAFSFYCFYAYDFRIFVFRVFSSKFER